MQRLQVHTKSSELPELHSAPLSYSAHAALVRPSPVTNRAHGCPQLIKASAYTGIVSTVLAAARQPSVASRELCTIAKRSLSVHLCCSSLLSSSLTSPLFARYKQLVLTASFLCRQGQTVHIRLQETSNPLVLNCSSVSSFIGSTVRQGLFLNSGSGTSYTT